MNECLTKPLLGTMSGCLVDNPTCTFAVRMGFSFLCSHPEHKHFHGKPADELNTHYSELRESRRSAYFDSQMQAYKDNPELVELFNYVKKPLESTKVFPV